MTAWTKFLASAACLTALLVIGTAGLLVGKGASPSAQAAAGDSQSNDKPVVPENWQIVTSLAGHQGGVKALCFSADGKRLFSVSFDGEIKVWDTQTHKEMASLIAHKGSQKCMALALSPSGDVLASLGAGPGGGEVKVWDAHTLKSRETFSYPRSAYCLAFSHGSDLIAAAGEQDVEVWSVGEGKPKHKVQAGAGMMPIMGLVFSPDDRNLYVGGSPAPAASKVVSNVGILRAWRLSDGTQIGEANFSHPVEGMALSEDGTTIAVAAGALHVMGVSAENNQVTFKERFSAFDRKLQGNSQILRGQFRGVALSPIRQVVAGAAGSPGPLAPDTGYVALFTLRDGRRIAQLETPRPANVEVHVGDYNISAVAFSADGKLLASGGKEGIVTLWTPTAIK